MLGCALAYHRAAVGGGTETNNDKEETRGKIRAFFVFRGISFHHALSKVRSSIIDHGRQRRPVATALHAEVNEADPTYAL
jgi:hypothetical protein